MQPSVTPHVQRYGGWMTGAFAVTAAKIGSAVLVHGMWSSPSDWRWVEQLLQEAHVEVLVPDLPSHRSTSGTVADDAGVVRQAIEGCSGPVVVVGWSYGGKVMSMAAAGESAVVRLIYVGDIPAPPDEVQTLDASWLDDPHILVGADGSFVLDNDWWFQAEAARLFSGEVLEHLRHHPRRLASRATATDPQTAAAWMTIPTTVLIGGQDDLLPVEQRRWAAEHLNDVRHLDTDHFILLRRPEAVAEVVLEALSRAEQARP
jgi:pimeloyl-ACP methyl ester carboxylesterase